MSAIHDGMINYCGINLQPVTVRRRRAGGKVAHLFIEFTNGAVSGTPEAFCRMLSEGKWEPAPEGLPLCNHCGRAFHRARRVWNGQP